MKIKNLFQKNLFFNNYNICTKDKTRSIKLFEIINFSV